MHTVPVFDGHNDFLLRLYNAPLDRDRIWLHGDGKGQMDLPRAKTGGFIGGFFAVYIPSPPDGGRYDDAWSDPPYAVPLPKPLDPAYAAPIAIAEMGHLLWMERTGTLSICRTTADIHQAIAEGRIAAVLHMEGAEAIGPDLDALHLWHAAGLRSLGPVWSRPTVFGHGVPFCFPSSPDTGDGLTAAGKDLIRECNALNIMVDLSHLNEKGFNDVAAISDAPLVATHSNAHAISPSSRNLTDRQLRMIAETRGMVGLNYACAFLRPDGRPDADTGFDVMLRHLDHLLSILGEDHVGLGSDFDGADIPAPLGDVAGLPRLIDAMRAHGYGDVLIQKMAWRNWIGVLDRTWR